MNDDQSLQSIMEEFKKGGWIVAVLGALGAIARLILTEERFVWVKWIRKAIAGAIVGTLVYFAVNPMPIDAMHKGILYASSGALAPDLFNWIREKFLQKAE